MNIAVVNNAVPFVRGGAEHLADALTRKLRDFGHNSLLVRIPFSWNPAETILDQIIGVRMMSIPRVDLVIALKFPAYFVPHPNKVVWLLHQFRQAYDFWGTEFHGLPEGDRGLRLKEAITRADNLYLPAAKRIYTNSKVTGDRLQRFNGIASSVLLPPLEEDLHFPDVVYEEFALCLGRVNATKRQLLFVEALRLCKTNIRLVIAGKAETEHDHLSISNAIKFHRLEDRVVFINRFISQEEKIDLLSRCLVCGYLPFDEDSYGYVTLEACQAQKPVITGTDSGGIHELVLDGTTGLIVPPEPGAIAEALDQLFLDREGAKRLGRSAQRHAQSRHISWEHVVKTLTS